MITKRMMVDDRGLACRLLIAALALPLVLATAPSVAAQDEPAPDAGEEAAEGEETQAEVGYEVTVTGSIIERQATEALSPVTSLAEVELATESTTRVEDLITALPQVFKGQNSTIANGASGTATVNLRNLGAGRTLVLINGRRMSAGDAFAVAADLNFIPSSLVRRVDVLTGGAGATYGADAVAGVVNFVLDTDFEGFRGQVRLNGYHHNNSNDVAQAANEARGFEAPMGGIFDGEGISASIAAGGKFADGAGHGSVYLDFRDVNAVTKSERDYFNCTINRGSDGPVCGGSSTTPQGRFISFDPDFGLNGDFVLDLEAGNEFKPRQGEVFNFGPFNHIQRPDRRFAGGGFAHVNINRHLEPYAEVMFMNNTTDAQIAPTGNFGRTTTINCDNPMLSQQQFDLICTQAGYGPTDTANLTVLRRNIEGGPRTSLLEHTSWRLLGGSRGDINDDWSYDFYTLYARVSSPQGYINDFHIDRIGDALNVVGDRNDPSSWQCASGNAGCVPWNIFQAGGVTDAAVDYMSVNTLLDSGTRTTQVVGTLKADLESMGMILPGASEGIQIAFGAEYREESLFVNPDEAQEKGLIAGFGGATVPVDGEYNTKEFFAEALIPLVQDADMAQDITVELGYRYSDYNLSGGNHSYKLLGSWAPTDAFRIRTGYNQAVRAPNAQELFSPQGFGLGGNEDICANDPATGVPSATLEQCQNTGVNPSQYGNILANPAQQYNTLNGGNPTLDVETANTFTLGVVWTPPSLNGLTASFDYYDINVKETIGSLDADDIINTCANTGDPLLCSLIHRDAAGTLWLTTAGFTETTNQNIGELRGRGMDVSASYPWLISADKGVITFSVIGSYLMENTFKNPLVDYDCAGFYGAQCGQPNSKWRHRFRATWVTNWKTDISVGWRYIGSTEVDDASDDEDLAAPELVASWELNDAAKLKAYNYLDVAATYRLADGWDWVFGIDNLLDSDPPLSPSLNDDGWFGTYDPLGRTIYTTVRFRM